ncbi:hypothetical protein TTE1058 [Caldanaerobacter subterraneus subsp. tengcongensis MB4]|uniref:Uncharacterized protein n=1 Tax=Caldanaerobacter subterraneus subsp. tengcongensis (strain DSM 15242 / JCM 11007 / NBRC 100824 / MB4) TaxID=273068 RepID=Q8RAX7_CALS4|nr:hypothetical protein TTE1058 [Caldanaerobacter subterraneus subsp. tengcongensis MB4]
MRNLPISSSSQSFLYTIYPQFLIIPSETSYGKSLMEPVSSLELKNIFCNLSTRLMKEGSFLNTFSLPYLLFFHMKIKNYGILFITRDSVEFVYSLRQ